MSQVMPANLASERFIWTIVSNPPYPHSNSYPRHLRSLLLALFGSLLRENITIPLTPSTGLQTPINGLALWEANCISEGQSLRTIAGYKILIQAYLKVDPFPTTLSIKQSLASKMQEISSSHCLSVFSYASSRHVASLWVTLFLRQQYHFR